MAKLAFDNPSGDLFTLNDAQIEQGLRASRESNRLRIILPIHRRQDAEVQRLVNFLQPGSYIRPHKHTMPHASESIVMGQFGFLHLMMRDSVFQIRFYLQNHCRVL